MRTTANMTWAATKTYNCKYFSRTLAGCHYLRTTEHRSPVWPKKLSPVPLCSRQPPFPRQIFKRCSKPLEMHWFKWTYFHRRALLYPQRCCQGHGAAKAAFARAASSAAALRLEMHWFKQTYFHERTLQRCCQGHGAAKAPFVRAASSAAALRLEMH
jgi:hypothetical protein